ncbi:Nudix family hydrolase [Acidithiobacillus sp.]|jgi:8-oxo-dGTP diphosphatase|uniref:Nudix family hydrolase n=1 Tax=Acidithiobacillus sp. TaxID=1872118 RepID=UPI0025BB07C7|nr:Nudix family hydrolase [Acidithiobacillus sp.]MCK9188201.1 Nudix family hydrolase [Acidithiobacillus sp.]MCK9360275.1 Nudix family hydrolase [Acidithiobacillus sp.]
MPTVPVATGIIEDASGRLLVSLRPEGKPWPGFWEFPGGKVDPGETPEQALVRELWEELGITVTAPEPFRVLEYTYPERTVRLHFYRVRHWTGTAHGREGQEVRWMYPWEIPALECLPANLCMTAAVLAEALPQPPLCLIADPGRVSLPDLQRSLEAALGAGLRWLVLRCKVVSDDSSADVLAALCAGALARDAQVYLNHPDPLPDWPRSGRHLTQAQLEAGVKPDEAFGVSCHDAVGLQQAARLGARYAFLSPIFPTSSHPGTAALGSRAFAAMAAESSLPVIALGGMTAARVPEALAAGARGVAVLSGILEARDPAAAARAFLQHWDG